MSKINLKKIKNTNILILLQVAEKLGIGFEVLDWEKYKIRFFKNGKTHIISRKSFGLNKKKGIYISADKNKTYQILFKNSLPVLKQVIVKNTKHYIKTADLIPFPQVLKDRFGEKGKNIYLNIKNKKEGIKAAKELFKKFDNAILEPFFEGDDYRFLVLNYKVIGIVKRKPPEILGDGKHTIGKLIKMENKRRLEYNKRAGKRMYNRLLVKERISWYLDNQNLDFDDVPKLNERIVIFPIANFSVGGTVEAINTRNVNSSFIEICKKTANAVGLTIFGIDILVKDIRNKAEKSNCRIIEINSNPGIRLHDWPNRGKSQNVAEKILEFIFFRK